MRSSRKNALLLSLLAFCAVGMVGAAFASVPLYRAFCRVTGFGGTTQRVTLAGNAAQPVVRDRWVTVSFDGNVDPNLPWDFGPDVKDMRVKLGDVVMVDFHARNRGGKTLVGASTFNVQPDKIGSYFDKVQCFCFNKQTLKPGEAVELPVQFFVDPALADDPQTNDVQNITLSYTFFQAKDQTGTP
jgi:cytochrome c oxidase assembly protein subunit 11